jgi:hypothetical protein
LELNGFFPRREDLESILRRCDHDANQNISFTEFVEQASGIPITYELDDFDCNSASPAKQHLES